MKAMILAAGEGARMRPLTETRPKVMLPIANRPILEHLLLEVREAGIGEFILVVGYRDEQVRDYFGDGGKWGVKIEYCTQRKQLGTADAVRICQGMTSGDFLMINGDIMVNREDIRRILAQKGTAMSVVEVKDVRGLGTVELKEGRVVKVREKSPTTPSRMANAGMYRFTPDILTAIDQTPLSPRGEYEITSSLQLMIDRGQEVFYQELGYWLNLSYPWDLLWANESLLAGLAAQNLGQIEENVVIRGAVSIGENTLIRSGSYLTGPVVIGANCDIGPHCYIRPSTAIGDRCHIGAAVEVKNSIVMKGSKIPHLSYVGDSVIGENCNLGAGTKVANLRLDGKEVEVAGISTGRRKLGAIIGDGVETGINSSINIGTMIGSNARIGPRALAHGVIAPGASIF